MEYLPFGELLVDEHLNSINSPFKFNGKMLDGETGNYYYGARYYDPKWSIWLSVDPLAEQTFDAYGYCYNNPIRFIDPDGMRASPIYGLDGKFLGTDSEGFQGEVLFMDESVYNFATRSQFKGEYTNSGGVLNHEQATRLGQNLDQVMGANPETDFTQSEMNMVNTAITDIVSKSSEMQFNVSDLYNSSTSAFFAEPTIAKNDGNKYFTLSANKGNSYIMGYKDSPASMRGNKMTFNLTSRLWKDGNFTVNNIQNAAAHEGNGHFANGVTGVGKGHAKAYQIQISHSSWKGTTPSWKSQVLQALKNVQSGVID